MVLLTLVAKVARNLAKAGESFIGGTTVKFSPPYFINKFLLSIASSAIVSEQSVTKEGVTINTFLYRL